MPKGFEHNNSLSCLRTNLSQPLKSTCSCDVTASFSNGSQKKKKQTKTKTFNCATESFKIIENTKVLHTVKSLAIISYKCHGILAFRIKTTGLT